MRANYSAERADLYSPWKRGSYFSEGSFNSEAALCAEMSRLAYCRAAAGLNLDQNTIQAAVAKVGFATSGLFESVGASQTGGTHAFLAVRNGGQSPAAAAVLAFRGTDSDDPTDFGDDADLILKQWKKGGRVHSGFERALEEVWGQIEPVLDKVQGRTIFTGHSLGAALATLATSSYTPDALYTFGSPRVGDQAFVGTLKTVNTLRRYVNCCDLVTRIPPEPLEYEHVGSPLYIDCRGNLIEAPSADVILRDRVTATGDYLQQYAWKTGAAAVRELADHAPINYVWALING
jgi:Lipase (class 3)